MREQQLSEAFNQGWATQLPREAVTELLKIAKEKQLEKGQRLHAKNDPPDGFYCVIDGKIRVSNVNSQGKEMVLTWLESGSWFGEISLFDGLPRTHDAHAEVATRLMIIPNQAFQAMLAQQPQLYPVFMRLLCHRIRLTFSIIDESGGLSLQGQLAKRLLLLADGWNTLDALSKVKTIHISQESLAHMINSSRQTVNKLLNEFKRQGAINLTYGSIEIVKPAILKQVSEL